MKELFIVNFVKKIHDDDESDGVRIESGTFEEAYFDEKSAIAAMLKDYESTKSDWEENASRDESQISGSASVDSCSLSDDFEGDTEDWFVTKIFVKEI